MTAATPLWKAICERLTADLAAGHYAPGDRLPTEAQLAARFGVNRHTVRRALGALAEADLVHARRGAGVFVTARPLEYPLGRRVRFHATLTAAGHAPERRLHRLETRRGDARETEALGLEAEASVHVCEGVSLADGAPLALFASAFPAERLPGFPEAMARENSVTRALAACGVADYTRASTRLTAVAATATDALHLHLSEGAPLLRAVAVNVDARGRPVEYGRTLFAGERVSLTVAPEEAP